jgi:hypothetical protein
MNLTKHTMLMLAVAAAAAGCGSSESSCPDGGCLDSAVTSGADAGSDGPALWGLSRGTNSYTITKVTIGNDGCMLGPDALMGMTRPVTYDEATNTISVGDQKGAPPAPSLGSGHVGANVATLSRDNNAGDAMGCYWHQTDAGSLMLFDNDKFTLDVTETDNMYSAACMAADKPGGESCTSTFQLTFVKM